MLSVSLVRFCRQESGAIAPLFGLSILVLLILSGVAIDSARSYRIASSAGQALDAAALATAKTLRLESPDDATLTKMATDYFKANFASEEGERVSYGDVTLAADRQTNKVQLQLHLQVPTTLTALLGKDKINVSARSTAIYDVRDVELSMMLDVSGSMGGSKMSDLKVAASDLVDILMDGNKAGSKHRIAIAPFSTAVNAGDYADGIVANRDQNGQVYAGAGTNCVTDRYGAHKFADKNPQAAQVRPALDVVSCVSGQAPVRRCRRNQGAHRCHERRRHDGRSPGHRLGVVPAVAGVGAMSGRLKAHRRITMILNSPKSPSS